MFSCVVWPSVVGHGLTVVVTVFILGLRLAKVVYNESSKDPQMQNGRVQRDGLNTA